MWRTKSLHHDHATITCLNIRSSASKQLFFASFIKTKFKKEECSILTTLPCLWRVSSGVKISKHTKTKQDPPYRPESKIRTQSPGTPPLRGWPWRGGRGSPHACTPLAGKRHTLASSLWTLCGRRGSSQLCMSHAGTWSRVSGSPRLTMRRWSGSTMH